MDRSQASDCPMAAALQENRVNLNREFRRLKRNVAMCKICIEAQGECQQSQSVTDEIRQALSEVLAEISPKEAGDG